MQNKLTSINKKNGRKKNMRRMKKKDTENKKG